MKKVVTIGGGTGSFMLLTGLKNYPIEISAIVSMADDGGSNGMLRDELGVLPPGDAKQCLLALSNCDQTLCELMNYRFSEGRLSGHNFGNLFITALDKMKNGFAEAIVEASKILNIKGEVIPVTNEDMRLLIKLKNGTFLKGEKVLDYHKEIHSIGMEEILLEKPVKATKEAIERIKKADFIIIGPGDHYGSIVPNLLVKGIPEAIAKSKAKVVYNCNLTNKNGQTNGYDLDRYVEKINEYIGKKNRIDFVTFNNVMPSDYLIEKYEKLEGSNSIIKLINEKKERTFRIIRADLIKKSRVKITNQELYSRKHSFIRHDSEKLARVLMAILAPEKYKGVIKKIV